MSTQLAETDTARRKLCRLAELASRRRLSDALASTSPTGEPGSSPSDGRGATTTAVMVRIPSGTRARTHERPTWPALRSVVVRISIGLCILPMRGAVDSSPTRSNTPHPTTGVTTAQAESARVSPSEVGVVELSVLGLAALTESDLAKPSSLLRQVVAAPVTPTLPLVAPRPHPDLEDMNVHFTP